MFGHIPLQKAATPTPADDAELKDLQEKTDNHAKRLGPALRSEFKHEGEVHTKCNMRCVGGRFIWECASVALLRPNIRQSN